MALTDPHMLLISLHNDILRLLSSFADKHMVGLAQASRHPLVRARLPNKLTRKLQVIDGAFNVIRHITSVCVKDFYHEISGHLGGAPNDMQGQGKGQRQEQGTAPVTTSSTVAFQQVQLQQQSATIFPTVSSPALQHGLASSAARAVTFNPMVQMFDMTVDDDSAPPRPLEPPQLHEVPHEAGGHPAASVPGGRLLRRQHSVHIGRVMSEWQPLPGDHMRSIHARFPPRPSRQRPIDAMAMKETPDVEQQQQQQQQQQQHQLQHRVPHQQHQQHLLLCLLLQQQQQQHQRLEALPDVIMDAVKVIDMKGLTGQFS